MDIDIGQQGIIDTDLPLSSHSKDIIGWPKDDVIDGGPTSDGPRYQMPQGSSAGRRGMAVNEATAASVIIGDPLPTSGTVVASGTAASG